MSIKVKQSIGNRNYFNSAKITRYSKRKKMNHDFYLTPYTKISLIWIIDLSVKAKNHKIFRSKQEIIFIT